MSSLPNADRQADIRITRWDLGRLQDMLGYHATTWSWKAVEFLAREMDRAQILDDGNARNDVVTMRSRVTYRIDDSGIDQVATLTYPGDKDLYDDALSVLTPIGAALIGLSAGQSIDFPAPDGSRRTLSVLKVLPRPEHADRRWTTPLFHAA